MGSLTSVVSNAVLAAGTNLAMNELSRANSRGSEDLALKQLQEQQNLQQRQRAADAALERDKIAVNAAQDEQERQRALKRAVSRQRANFSAQGIGAGQGSSQAVLLGLFDESEEERDQRDQLDGLRLTALDQDLAQGQALNVLQRTQLQEKQAVRTAAQRRAEFIDLF